MRVAQLPDAVQADIEIHLAAGLNAVDAAWRAFTGIGAELLAGLDSADDMFQVEGSRQGGLVVYPEEPIAEPTYWLCFSRVVFVSELGAIELLIEVLLPPEVSLEAVSRNVVVPMVGMPNEPREGPLEAYFQEWATSEDAREVAVVAERAGHPRVVWSDGTSHEPNRVLAARGMPQVG